MASTLEHGIGFRVQDRFRVRHSEVLSIWVGLVSPL